MNINDLTPDKLLSLESLGMKIFCEKEGRKERWRISRFWQQWVSKSDDTLARIKELDTIGKALEYLESFYRSKKDWLVEDTC